MAGGGDAADVETTAGADRTFIEAISITRSSGDGLDGGASAEACTLVGDVAALGVGVDSGRRGVSRAHEHNRRGLSNQVDVTISATNTAASTGPTREALARPEAGMSLQPAVDADIAVGDSRSQRR